MSSCQCTHSTASYWTPSIFVHSSLRASESGLVLWRAVRRTDPTVQHCRTEGVQKGVAKLQPQLLNNVTEVCEASRSLVHQDACC